MKTIKLQIGLNSLATCTNLNEARQNYIVVNEIENMFI